MSNFFASRPGNTPSQGSAVHSVFTPISLATSFIRSILRPTCVPASMKSNGAKAVSVPIFRTPDALVRASASCACAPIARPNARDAPKRVFSTSRLLMVNSNQKRNRESAIGTVRNETGPQGNFETGALGMVSMARPFKVYGWVSEQNRLQAGVHSRGKPAIFCNNRASEPSRTSAVAWAMSGAR